MGRLPLPGVSLFDWGDSIDCGLAESQGIHLRIDTDAEDDIVRKLLRAAEQICMDVARMDEEEFKSCGAIAKIAVLYALAYFYEHRD